MNVHMHDEYCAFITRAGGSCAGGGRYAERRNAGEMGSRVMTVHRHFVSRVGERI